MRVRVALVFLGICCTLYGAELARSETGKDGLGDLGLDSLLSISVSAAAKHEQSTTEAPASVTILTSEEIARHGYRTLADALASVRGFYTAYDYNYTYLGVRGFGRPGDFNDRVLLLWNGHTLNENVYGSAAVGTDLGISLENVTRIEIVRGPGSALYGTSAMLAVINVVTEDGNQIDGAKGSVEIGNEGRFGGSAAFGKHFTNGLNLAVNGTWMGIDGGDVRFAAPGGSVLTQDIDWDRYRGVSAQGRYRDVTINALATSRRKGIPTGSYETIMGDPRTQARDQRRFLDVKYDGSVNDKMGLMLRGYYDQYFYDGTWAYEAASRDSSRGEWLGAEGQWRWDVIPSNRMVLGAEIQSHRHATYRSWDEDTVYFDGDFPYNVQSAYFQNETQLASRVAVTAGLRYDHYSEGGSALSPRLAVLLYPNKVGTVKLLYGEAFRTPNVSERAIGNGVDVQQNPDLESENLRMYEAVWESRISRRLYASASIFHYRMHNLIDQVEDTLSGISMFENVTRTYASGVGVDLNVELPHGWDAYISYGYQDAYDPELDIHLTNSPRHIFNGSASAPLARFFRLSAIGRWESERTTVHDTKTDPFFLASATLSFQPSRRQSTEAAPVWQNLRLTLSINNLFDTEYELPAGTEHTQTALPQYGRQVSMKLSLGL